MPIYEYSCEQCGHQLEILQKIGELPAKTCPECGAECLRKRISAVTFKLKGTGWYETDFKNKKPEKESKTETKTAPKESASSSKHSENGSQDQLKSSAGGSNSK